MIRGITAIGADQDITVAGVGTDHDIIVIGMVIVTTITIHTIRRIQEEIVTDMVPPGVTLLITDAMAIHREDMLHRITATGIHQLVHVRLMEQAVGDRQLIPVLLIAQMVAVCHQV